MTAGVNNSEADGPSDPLPDGLQDLESLLEQEDLTSIIALDMEEFFSNQPESKFYGPDDDAEGPFSDAVLAEFQAECGLEVDALPGSPTSQHDQQRVVARASRCQEDNPTHTPTQSPVASNRVTSTPTINTTAVNDLPRSQSTSATRPRHFARQSSQLRNELQPGLQSRVPSSAVAHSKFQQMAKSSPSLSRHERVSEVIGTSAGAYPSKTANDFSHGPVRGLLDLQEQHRTSLSRHEGVSEIIGTSAGAYPSKTTNDFSHGPVLSPMIRPHAQAFQESNVRSPIIHHSTYPMNQFEHMNYVQSLQHSHHYVHPVYGGGPIHGSSLSGNITNMGFNTLPQSLALPTSLPNTSSYGPSPDVMKLEALSPPHTHARVKKEASNGKRKSKVINPQIPYITSHQSYNEDEENVAKLVEAMKDISAPEDNPGMLQTWVKIRTNKAKKVREKCVELLEIIHKAQSHDGPLGEKRTVNTYSSFEDRFDAVINTLKTQKTVCKHLLEDPYSYQVVDDPVNALKRVQNNRRVNQQKKEAITEGRKRLGEKGQGKGRPNLKIEKVHDDNFDDEDNSADDPLSEIESEVPTPIASRGTKSRKTCQSTSIYDSEIEHDMDNPPAPKKIKRDIRSKYAIVSGIDGRFQVIDSADNGHMQTMNHISNGQYGHDPTNYSQKYSNNPVNQHPYAPTQPLGVAQFQNLNQPCEWSSGTEPDGITFSEPFNGSADTDGHGESGLSDNDAFWGGNGQQH